MAKKKKKRTISRGGFFAVMLLFLLMNIVMAFVMMNVSQKELREQIEARMLDIANTAAYQLNGDELKTLTAEDKGTEPYNRALETLRAFQDNIQLDYIYGIQQEADGSFSFTIDPAPEDPGEFDAQMEKNCRNGEVVVSTGMAEFDDDEDDSVEDVFERADQKMYERKRYLKSL